MTASGCMQPCISRDLAPSLQGLTGTCSQLKWVLAGRQALLLVAAGLAVGAAAGHERERKLLSRQALRFRVRELAHTPRLSVQQGPEQHAVLRCFFR